MWTLALSIGRYFFANAEPTAFVPQPPKRPFYREKTFQSQRTNSNKPLANRTIRLSRRIASSMPWKRVQPLVVHRQNWTRRGNKRPPSNLEVAFIAVVYRGKTNNSTSSMPFSCPCDPNLSHQAPAFIVTKLNGIRRKCRGKTFATNSSVRPIQLMLHPTVCVD